MMRRNLALRNSVIYIFLGILTLFACWLFAGRHGVFASRIDWMSQHSVLPDYFRQQFYQTGELFPEFAANLGGGQNIYHFSYYGLYSPVVLLSYLLPFVKMSDYLIAASVCHLALSVMLLHYWLKNHGFSSDICFFVSLLFLLAAPMIFQSYRHIMFVDYMPFLCMAFLGVDRYWESGKTGLYTAGVFLMILTSFYFSIGGIFALVLYGISRSKKMPQKHSGIIFFLPILTAVLASSILLVPTLCALLERTGSLQTYSLRSLLTFDFSVGRFAYDGYGIGLTGGILTILFLGFTYKNRREKLLSAACLLVLTLPVFSWILNGGLYTRGKVLIPFLPLLLFLTALYLDKQKKREIPFLIGLAGHFLTILWCTVSYLLFAAGHQELSAAELLLWGSGKSIWLYRLIFTEWILSFVFFIFYQKCRFLPLLILPSVICLVVNGICFNEKNGNFVKKDFYEKTTDTSWSRAISDILEQEAGFYRMEQKGTYEERQANINRIWNGRQWVTSVYSSVYQKDYKEFCREIFEAEQPFRNDMAQSVKTNPLFRKLMGVKYVIEKEEDSEKYAVDIQEHTAPVIYATNRVISEEAYHKLSFPYTQTLFAQYAVIEDVLKEMDGGEYLKGTDTVRQTDISISEDSKVTKEGGGYTVRSDHAVHTVLSVFGKKEDSFRERLLYIQFDVKNNNKNKDIVIDLAGVRNNLCARSHIYYNGNTTFTYVIKLKKYQSKTDITFGEGDYSIENIRSFLGGISVLSDETLYQSDFLPDWSMIKGNQISGKIIAEHAGYVITSIPYDKGFEIFVDGKRVAAQKVNLAFLGASIEKGEHWIEIVYHAPGMKIGKLFSCIGLALWILKIFLQNG